MLIDQSNKVPISPAPPSARYNTQLPFAFGAVIKLLQLFTFAAPPFDGNEAANGGDVVMKPSALNVPVRGAGAPLSAVTPLEETTVLVKLAVAFVPPPPFKKPTRLKKTLQD